VFCEVAEDRIAVQQIPHALVVRIHVEPEAFRFRATRPIVVSRSIDRFTCSRELLARQNMRDRADARLGKIVQRLFDVVRRRRQRTLLVWHAPTIDGGGR
jgi:hypothetical protein